MQPKFNIDFLPEAVFFLEQLEVQPRDKIYFNLVKAQSINDIELFKKLNSYIWEFRTQYNGKAYRLFAFWDKSDPKKTIVIVTHGILKKTDKVPLKEIQKADSIRIQYFAK